MNMKKAQNPQSIFLVLSKALSEAAARRQTTDEFVSNVRGSITGNIQIRCETAAPAPKRDTVGEGVEIIVPVPLPNEILQGWRGRVAALNCIESVHDVEPMLRALAVKRAYVLGDDPDFIQCASAALDVDRKELILGHTLTPFFDSLDKLKPNKPGRPGQHLRTYQKRAPLRIDGDQALFCPQCAAEDVAFWGFSYWRRGHQLPGVLCCSTHAMPLVVAGNRKCFDRCPDYFVSEQAQQCVQPEDDTAKAILLRYARIAEEILDSALTIDSAMASFLLGTQAKAASLRISRPGVRKTLSTHLMDLLPRTWLESTFPRVTWQRDKYISTIDGVCIPNATRYTASTLCLLTAVFYDDTDQAITDLMSSAKCEREPYLGFEFWASLDVFNLYCENDGVFSRMADAIGVSSSAVSVGLLNQGMPGLGGKSVSMKTALRAFFAGESIEASCQSTGVPKEAFIALLRASGGRLAKALDRMTNASPTGKQPGDATGKARAVESETSDQITKPE
jgi:hypothetical protein